MILGQETQREVASSPELVLCRIDRRSDGFAGIRKRATLLIALAASPTESRRDESYEITRRQDAWRAW
jgi:hypothetical protein